ncbi:C-terminal helicase domain-containing protein [Streptomyces erythrochromogenes]|uniref:C-terminal helicase domain-containing protein n=1 Tax=Streptomyces erythrochromogenes TaxID=285574 RepID=UPI00340FFC1C
MTNRELSLDEVIQFYFDVGHEKSKIKALSQILDRLEGNKAVVFVNSARRAEELSKVLAAGKWPVTVLHAQLGREEQRAAADEFQSGSFGILVTMDGTDGVDRGSILVVINYDLPSSSADYIERVGRQGAHSPTRVAISLLVDGQRELLKEFEEFHKTKIEKLPDSSTVPYLA